MKVGLPMKSSKQVYLNRKGFSLMELILGICITSILLMCFYSLLHYAINTSKISDAKDNILTNGRYALLYIKEEVKNADRIVDITKFKDLDEYYPQNIGFVILEKSNIEAGKINHNYKTYYLNDNKLVRLACNVETSKYPSENFFAGYNELCKGLKLLEKFNYNTDKNVLKIRLTLNNGSKDFDFKSDVFLNCPIDLNDGGEDG